MKQTLKFAVAFGLLVVMAAGVVVMVAVAAANAVSWVAGL